MGVKNNCYFMKKRTTFMKCKKKSKSNEALLFPKLLKSIT